MQDFQPWRRWSKAEGRGSEGSESAESKTGRNNGFDIAQGKEPDCRDPRADVLETEDRIIDEGGDGQL